MSLTTPTRRSTVSVPCDAGLIYDVLTDYESYAEWLPMVVASKTLAREGDLAIAEFELEPPARFGERGRDVRQRARQALGVVARGAAGNDVLALAVQAHEAAVERGIDVRKRAGEGHRGIGGAVIGFVTDRDRGGERGSGGLRIKSAE